jgi:glycosyltransferase involved in cell wall biosynthesis
MKVMHLMRTVRAIDGGPTRALLDNVSVLSRRGHQVSVLACEVDTGLLPERQVINLGQKVGSWPHLSSATKAVVKCEMSTTDILHVHLPWDPLNLSITKLAQEAGVPYCVSLRGTLDDWSMSQKWLKKRIYMAFFARQLLEGAAFVHCTANDERRQSEVWYPQGRSKVIPNLLDLGPFKELPGVEEARSRYRIRDGQPLILFMSRLHAKKGLRFLIDAMSLVLVRSPAARLLVAGDGDARYVEKMRALVHDAGLSNSVEFIGHVNGSLKYSLLQAASCFVLPSSQENFGFALFEAAAVGTPIVVTNLVDTWRELQSGASAEITDQTAISVSKGILNIISTDAQQGAIQRASSRAWALEYLDTDRIASMFEQAYAESLRPRC